MDYFSNNEGGSAYNKRFEVFREKSDAEEKDLAFLQQHLPTQVRKTLPPSPPSSSYNVLSIGSGNGTMDITIAQLIREELQRNEKYSDMKIYNRAVEPNANFLSIYRAALANLPRSLNDDLTVFDFNNKTFAEYMEHKQDQIKYDMVHFIGSLYYVPNMEQALVHCYEKELHEKGIIVCSVERKKIDLKGESLWHCMHTLEADTEKKQLNQVHSEAFAEDVINVVEKHGWKYEKYTNNYSVDITEVFDENSEKGNLLLDFLVHIMNFRGTADKETIEKTLQYFEKATTITDGKRLGNLVDELIFIYK